MCPERTPDFIGDPGWIRTSDLQLRRLLLYPLSYGATRPPNIYRILRRNARLIVRMGLPPLVKNLPMNALPASRNKDPGPGCERFVALRPRAPLSAAAIGRLQIV